MDLDQDMNQNDAHITPSNPSLNQVPPPEVPPDMRTKKLSVGERLARLSKYRIHQTQIKRTAEPNGKGGKADVVRASFKRKRGARRGKRVAVKKLRCTDASDVDEKLSKEFVHEVELLAKLSHKNIVELIGFVEDLKHQKAWIVLSWEPNGNVREFLGSGKWEIPERISLIKDMFKGLQYLHTRKPPICHGDLKSLNILVSSSYHAIITDFGSARVLRSEDDQVVERENTQQAARIAVDAGDDCAEVTVVASANQLTLTGPVWSLRWAAPELVKEEARPGLASDIWSAGWVCWEMMTSRVPFEDLKRDTAIMLKVIQGELPSIQEDAEVAQVVRLCSLMTDCWKYRPEQRIHVDECCREVQWMPSIPPLGGTSSGDKAPSPFLLLKMGRMHYEQHRHEKAAALFKKVVTSTESGVDEGVIADAMEHLGEIYRAQSKYAEAEESSTRAREIYARIGDDQGRAHTVRGLGDVYRAQSKYAEAEELYTRAQEIYARVGDDLGRAHTIRGLGDVYQLQSKYAEAEESSTRAQEIYARIGDDQGRAHTIRGLGHVYYAQSKDAEAEESYTRAQEIYARIGDDQGRATTLRGLGHLYREQGHRMDAAAFYVQARDLFSQIGLSVHADDASYWLDIVLDGGNAEDMALVS